MELVMQKRSVRVSELQDLFQVSEVTIRKDLDLLAQQGLLLRKRGGAIADTHVSLAIAFDQRARLNQEEKRRIGYAAARLVEPGDTILMDAGSTLMEMAKSLGMISPLTVVTSALNVAIQVGAISGIRVMVVGGSLNGETISTVGPNAVRDLNTITVRKVFLGGHALEPKAGLTDTSIEIAQMKQTMIGAGRNVILLADSSKWGRVAFAKVVPLSAIHTLVTDTGLPAEARAEIERMGIELVLA